MYKLVLLFRKREDMTHEEFVRYWREVHIPLVKKVPNIRRYVISPVCGAPLGEPDFDGMAELWFEDEQTALAALATPETAATGRDARNFVMKGSMRRFFSVEEEIISG